MYRRRLRNAKIEGQQGFACLDASSFGVVLREPK